jgi:hypothetical protein
MSGDNLQFAYIVYYDGFTNKESFLPFNTLGVFNFTYFGTQLQLSEAFLYFDTFPVFLEDYLGVVPPSYDFKLDIDSGAGQLPLNLQTDFVLLKNRYVLKTPMNFPGAPVPPSSFNLGPNTINILDSLDNTPVPNDVVSTIATGQDIGTGVSPYQFFIAILLLVILVLIVIAQPIEKVRSLWTKSSSSAQGHLGFN